MHPTKGGFLLLLWASLQEMCWVATIIHEKNAMEVNIISIDPGETAAIKSHGYPNHCCKPMNWTVEVTASKNLKHYLVMTFDDLDLPCNSTLIIYDGSDASSRPFKEQPRCLDGHWIRPFLASTGSAIFIYFKPGNVGKQQYVGFKARYWTSTDKPSSILHNPPITDCPTIEDPLASGVITLDTLSSPLTQQLYYDCVWQIKVPFLPTKFEVFFKLLNLTLFKGELKVLSGIHSEASVLYSIGHNNLEDGDILDQTLDLPSVHDATSASNNGLYIHARKPLNQGYLQFMYGVYQDTLVYHHRTSCNLQMAEGEHIPGFKCHESSWCIPVEAQCNGLNNCPDNSDEHPSICQGNETATVDLPKPDISTVTSPAEGSQVVDHVSMLKSGSSLFAGLCDHQLFKQCDDGSCVPFYESCGGNNSCGAFRKLCADDACITPLASCAFCLVYQKQCINGTCSTVLEACQKDETKRSLDHQGSEDCPSYKPYLCESGRGCYGGYEKCNGVLNCIDGSDEIYCDKGSDKVHALASIRLSNMSYLWLVMLFVPAVCFIALICYCCLSSSRRHGTHSNPDNTLPLGNAAAPRSAGNRYRAPANTVPIAGVLPSQPNRNYQQIASAPFQNGQMYSGNGLSSRESLVPPTSSYQAISPPPAYDDVVPASQNEDSDLPSYTEAVSRARQM